MTQEEYEKLQNTSVATDKPELKTSTDTTNKQQPTLQNTATQYATDSMNSHIPDSAQKQQQGISTAISAEDINNTTAGKLDNNDYVKEGKEISSKINPIDNKEKEKFYTTQTTDDLRKQAIDKAIQSGDLSSIALMYKGMDDATKANWQNYVDAHTKKDSKLNNKATETADVANGDFTKSTDYNGRDGTKTGDDIGQKIQNSLNTIRQRDDGQTPSSTGTDAKATETKETDVNPSPEKKGVDWGKIWDGFKNYLGADMGGGGSRGYYLLDAIGKGMKNYGESWRGGAQTDTAYNAQKGKEIGGNIENKLSASKITGDTEATTKADINRLNTFMNSSLNKLSADEKKKLTETLKMVNTGKTLTAKDYMSLLGGELFNKVFGVFTGGN